MNSRWWKGLVLGAFGLLALSGCSEKFPVLHPVGPVGEQELFLIKFSTLLAAIVVIPVIALLIFIVYRYRDKPDNQAPYQPEWSESKTLEFVWWAIPILIIGILGAVTAKQTFALTHPPKNSGEPLTIQVTSLDWKWVFMYPDQHIATVNYAEIPAGRPIQFVLTADAPMNSFWVPALGGQEYAMPGMAMRLWLQADKTGTYKGKGANFTGKGFAHMTFDVKSVNESDFNKWVADVKKSAPALTKAGYKELRKPSVMGKKSFSSYPKDLFMDTVMKNGGKYMNNHWMMMDQPEKQMDHHDH